MKTFLKTFSRRVIRRATRQVELIQSLEGRRLLSVSLPTEASDSAMASVRVNWAAEATVRKLEIIGRDTNGSPTSGFSDYTSDLPLDVPLSVVPPEPHALPLPEKQGGSLPNPSSAATPAAPVAGDVFALNSLPGADQVIYLDFNGHTTSGTHWNNQFTGGSPFTTPAYNFEGSGATFSTSERAAIEEVWLRVVEDFAPFNVNVTTQDPGLDYLSRNGSGDAEWGVRVVIGGSSSQWFGSGAGGVAYPGSFNWSNDTPTYVFPLSLGNNAKNIAEAASHEAGHTLGLGHDGRGNDGYYSGHGGGTGTQTSWSPLMGVGYYTTLSQWSSGQYNDATNTENDLNIITSSQNGFGYKADDHSDNLNTINDGTPLELNDGGVFSTSGLISANNDEDNFTFEHDGGQVVLSVNPAAVGPNLDASLELFRWNGSGWSLIARDNNSFFTSATVSGNYDPGTYLVRVNGVGWGNPYATNPSGYTEYGSLGQYALAGSFIRNTDTTAPQVTGLWLGSTQWTSAVNNELDLDEGLGMALELGSGNTQLASVPFANVNQVRVRFSEEVVVNADALSVATSTGQPVTPVTFDYDDTTFTATWTLDGSFARGAYNLIVNDSAVADAAGNVLDGEWDNPTSRSDTSSDTFPSGNGAPGGDFALAANVLPGDSNRDGTVSLADFLALRGAFGSSSGGSTYSLFADYDGSGNVSLADFLALRSNFGQTV